VKNILLPYVLIANIIATPSFSQSVDEFTQEEVMAIRTRVYAEYYERSCKEEPKQKPSDKKPSKEINSEAYSRVYEMQKTEAEAELKVIGQEAFCAMAKGAAEKYAPDKNKPISQDNKGN
jgi:hypothetical protein